MKNLLLTSLVIITIALNSYAQSNTGIIDVGVPGCDASWIQSPKLVKPCINQEIVFTATDKTESHLWAFFPLNPLSQSFPSETLSTSPIVKVVFPATGGFIIKHTIIKSENRPVPCTEVVIDTIYIVPPPDASFSVFGVPDSCTHTPITFLANQDGGLWDFGLDANPSSATGRGPHQVSYNRPGVKEITYTIAGSGSCSATDTQYIKIKGTDPSFRPPSGTIEKCFKNPLQLLSSERSDSVNHIWGLPSGVIYNINYGSTPTSKDPYVDFVTDGTYTITHVTNVDMCFDTVMQSITIEGAPDPNFAHSPVVNCSKNNLIVFTGITAPISTWDFGDPSSPNNQATGDIVSHQYTDFGKYLVRHTVQRNGCEEVAEDTVKIYSKPNPDFSFTGRCESDGNYVSFHSYAEDATHLWVFSPSTKTPTGVILPSGPTSTTDKNPVAFISNDGYYTVRHYVAYPNGILCDSIIEKDIYLSISFDPGFSIVDPNITCTNSNLPVSFISNINTSTHLVHHWDFGDGTSSNQENPSHTFPVGSRIYNVVHTVKDTITQCEKAECAEIRVFNTPDASYDTYDQNYQPTKVCLGNKVTFETRCNAFGFRFCDPRLPSNAYYCGNQWEISKLSINNPTENTVTRGFNHDFTYTFSDPGVYVLTHIVNWSKTCYAIQVDTFILILSPNSSFTTDNQVICEGKPVCFTPIAQGSGYRHHWDFGDGSTSDDEYPCHSYADVSFPSQFYIVSHQLSASGCSSSESNAFINILDASQCCGLKNRQYDYPGADQRTSILVIADNPQPDIYIEGTVYADSVVQGMILRNKNLHFGPYGRFEIDNSSVKLENCSLLAADDCYMWQGIRVYGKYRPYSSVKAAKLITSNVTIKDAYWGISNIDSVESDTAGNLGHLQLSKTSFENNYISMNIDRSNFFRYVVDDCSFTNDGKLKEHILYPTLGGDFYAFISSKVRGDEEVSNSKFEYIGTGGNYKREWLIGDKHIGISAAYIYIRDCKFRNLYKAMNPMHKFINEPKAVWVAYNSVIEDCYYGIYSMDIIDLRVNCNLFRANVGTQVKANWYIDGSIDNPSSCLPGFALGNIFRNNPIDADIVLAPTATGFNYYYQSGGSGVSVSDLMPSVLSNNPLATVALIPCAQPFSCASVLSNRGSMGNTEAPVISVQPNPVNTLQTLVFSYAIPLTESGVIKIIDLLGRTVAEYSVDGGYQEKAVVLGDLLPGIYLFRIETGNQVSKIGRMVLVE